MFFSLQSLVEKKNIVVFHLAAGTLTPSIEMPLLSPTLIYFQQAVVLKAGISFQRGKSPCSEQLNGGEIQLPENGRERFALRLCSEAFKS